MTSVWTSQVLLEPVSAEEPCGESLEDTQLLASFDTFRVFGQSTPLEPPPDWPVIKARALEALGRSKDLRLLAHLAGAVLRTDGFPAFAETLGVASRWLEAYWTQAYPTVAEDAILRRNALNCFADPIGVIDGLRRVPLVSSRAHGTVSLREYDIASGQMAPKDGDPRPTEEQINAAFRDAGADELGRLQESVQNGLAALRSIDTQMREAAGSDAAPNFDLLTAQLTRISRMIAPHLAQPAQADPAAGGEVGPAAGVSAGAVRSRQEAIAALDAVAEFFRRTEPSSPIPLFLGRAKRLVSKDFLEVLADVAPDAVAQARMAGGLRDGE